MPLAAHPASKGIRATQKLAYKVWFSNGRHLVLEEIHIHDTSYLRIHKDFAGHLKDVYVAAARYLQRHMRDCARLVTYSAHPPSVHMLMSQDLVVVVACHADNAYAALAPGASLELTYYFRLLNSDFGKAHRYDTAGMTLGTITRVAHC